MFRHGIVIEKPLPGLSSRLQSHNTQPFNWVVANYSVQVQVGVGSRWCLRLADKFLSSISCRVPASQDRPLGAE
jgi:hypothetical protein